MFNDTVKLTKIITIIKVHLQYLLKIHYGLILIWTDTMK